MTGRRTNDPTNQRANEQTNKRCNPFVVLAVLWTTVASPGSASGPSLDTVLVRIERYVVSYERELSTLVAREQSVQTATTQRPNDPTTKRSNEETQVRTLISDFLFLRLPGDDGPWLGFRDVLEVDGRPIENHTERLYDIVSASPGDAAARAALMARENARYNLGRVLRTVNVPIGVVAWLHPGVRRRFAFKKSGEEEIDGARSWRIEFKERRRPTLVHTPGGRDVPSSGRVWVDPDDGRVLQTEQVNTLDALHVTIQVRFRMNQDFGLLVPWRMQERYEDREGRLDTEAVYSEFRRFGVSTRIR